MNVLFCLLCLFFRIEQQFRDSVCLYSVLSKVYVAAVV